MAEPAPTRRKSWPARHPLLTALLGFLVLLFVAGGLGALLGPPKNASSNSAVGDTPSTSATATAATQQTSPAPTPTQPVVAATTTHAAPVVTHTVSPATHSTPPPKSTPPPTPQPTPKPTPKPSPTPTPKPVNLCGAPSNPFGYNFCSGPLIYAPAAGVCAYFACIPNFPKGKGYMVECNDGMYSMSGGRSGACSYHQGEFRPVYG
jgi:hypothetical protein